MNSDQFLAKLTAEAKLQSKLSTHRVLPKQLDGVTSFIGNYPWQVLLVVSFLTAVMWAI